MATSLPITWAQTMVSASHWVGLTLPGMIELPGSLAGRSSSPRPQRGPEPSRRTSLAIFIRRAGERPQRAAGVRRRRRGRRGPRSWLRRGDEGEAGHLGDGCHRQLAETGVGVEPGADRGAAQGELVEAGERGARPGACRLDLARPAADLLTEGQRDRVHEVGAADLDHRRPSSSALARERRGEAVERGQEAVRPGTRPRRRASRWGRRRWRTATG